MRKSSLFFTITFIVLLIFLLTTALAIQICKPEHCSSDILDSSLTSPPPKDSVSNNTNLVGMINVIVKPNSLGLKDFALANGLNFGSAVNSWEICLSSEGDKKCNSDSEVYRKTLVKEFNLIVPANEFKWGFIHPDKNEYNFLGGDYLLNFAQDNNMKIRGHTLVWFIENPKWLFPTEKKYIKDCTKWNSKWSKEELLVILKEHITTVVGHYKGKVESWDVINEPFYNGEFYPSCWYSIIGPTFIEEALKYAREADPNAKLLINQNHAEEINKTSDLLYETAKYLLDKNIPLDGIGLQFHEKLDDYEENIDEKFASIEANIKRFSDLGLEIYITETDVELSKRSKINLNKQAEVYKRITALALKYPNIKNILTWGVSDKHSWLGTVGAALLFDRSYKPKPAYYAVCDCLKKETC